MAPSLEISIPTTTVSSTPKPYTLYNITLRLPLRSYTVQKRYSDFLTLHSQLTSQASAPPPASLPAKSWFTRTVSSPELTEHRREDLETYLKVINSTSDSRWRNTSAWRTFLNLPSSYVSSSAAAKETSNNLHSALTSSAPITDPTLWLDTHRTLKQELHNARLQLTNRDQASAPQKQHEASAAAKTSLVKSSHLISSLEDGLTTIQKSTHSRSGGPKLGDGEIRRRRDLIASAKKDHDGLESLLNAMTAKSQLDSTVANMADKSSLLDFSSAASTTTASSKPKTGRVLGRETAETRELDNQGVVQLQKQKLAEQDLDVEKVRKIVQRQKDLGIQIHEELEVQNEMLRMVDEDVDRVKGKIDVAKKRVGKLK